MTYERRRSPNLAFHCYAPHPPHDITPPQVRDYLAEHQDVKVVRLSGGLMDRPKVVQDDWRQLDVDLSEAGIDVYFGFGGTCTWEAGFSDGKPPGPARRPFAPTLAAAAPKAGVIPGPEGTDPQDPMPGLATNVRGENPPDGPTLLGNQPVMLNPNVGAFIDINDPEDDAIAMALVGPVGGVTVEPAVDGLPEPVLHQESASPSVKELTHVDDLISQIAARPGIGGYRKIAAALESDYDINVSHMKVKRVAETPPAAASASSALANLNAGEGGRSRSRCPGGIARLPDLHRCRYRTDG